MFEPKQLIEGKILFINGGMNPYYIPDTAFLPVILKASLRLKILLVILHKYMLNQRI